MNFVSFVYLSYPWCITSKQSYIYTLYTFLQNKIKGQRFYVSIVSAYIACTVSGIQLTRFFICFILCLDKTMCFKAFNIHYVYVNMIATLYAKYYYRLAYYLIWYLIYEVNHEYRLVHMLWYINFHHTQFIIIRKKFQRDGNIYFLNSVFS